MKQDPFKGTVSTLAFGGDGVIREEGLVIFCPFTIPGENIEGVIEERKKSYARGKALNILNPSPLRIQPRCSYFGVCGGCQLQHIDYPAQLEVKRQWIREALQKIGGLTEIQVEPVTPSQPWTYRRHITLTLFPLESHYQAGYSAISQGEQVIPENCPIFIEENDPILRQVQSVAKKFKNSGQSLGKVTIFKHPNHQFSFEFHFKHLPSNAKKILQEAVEFYPEWTSILCKAPHKTLKWGKTSFELNWNSHSIHYDSGAFLQNNPEVSGEMYKAIDQWAQIIHPNCSLDLYSGIGITSMILGQYSRSLTAIELNLEAIRLAKKNFKNGEMIQGDVGEKLQSIAKLGAYDTVLLNPPREGAGLQVMQLIAQIQPAHIAYISCMPPTLARDLKYLYEQEYKITRCKPYDMFPQTAHVETVVFLERIKGQ